MKKETSKLLFLLAGLLLPVILTFLFPLIKILLADQYHYTGYRDGNAAVYMVKDFMINGMWALGFILYILWNLGGKDKFTVISNIFMAVCALSACYIVLMRSDILNFVRFIDNSTYTLETVLVCMACALLIRKVHLHK